MVVVMCGRPFDIVIKGTKLVLMTLKTIDITNSKSLFVLKFVLCFKYLIIIFFYKNPILYLSKTVSLLIPCKVKIGPAIIISFF